MTTNRNTDVEKALRRILKSVCPISIDMFSQLKSNSGTIPKHNSNANFYHYDILAYFSF